MHTSSNPTPRQPADDPALEPLFARVRAFLPNAADAHRHPLAATPEPAPLSTEEIDAGIREGEALLGEMGTALRYGTPSDSDAHDLSDGMEMLDLALEQLRFLQQEACHSRPTEDDCAAGIPESGAFWHHGPC